MDYRYEVSGVGKKAFLLLLSVLLVFGVVFPALADENKNPDMSSLEEIHEYIINNHIDKKDDGVLIRGAIEGMLDALEDPYSTYYPPENLEDFQGSINGEYAGIGVGLEPGELYPKVNKVFEKSPAREAGVIVGDLVVKVDGADVAGESIDRVVDRIRGHEGTKVHLLLRREGKKDFEVDIKRASINIPTSEWRLLEDGTGYINIASFGSRTPDEFENGLKNLREKGAANLILDLRDCPGGLLSVAVKIAGNFIEEGNIVTSTIDRDGNREVFRAGGHDAGKGMRVAVLVNHNSASAAEILAGALQDYGVGVVIGGTTYGKGSVQALIPLKSGGALKLTTARYHTANDRAIDGLGLKPDIQVLSSGLQLVAAGEYFHPRERKTVLFSRDGETAKINDSSIKVDRVPIQRDGKSYLPLRFTAEALGYRVDWQEESESVKVSGDGKEIVFETVGGKVLADGRETGGSPVLIMDGTTYMPAEDLTFLGAGLKEDETGTCIEK